MCNTFDRFNVPRKHNQWKMDTETESDTQFLTMVP